MECYKETRWLGMHKQSELEQETPLNPQDTHAKNQKSVGVLFVARAALLACVLGWHLSCVCAFGGFLLLFLIACACLTTSLCNVSMKNASAIERW